MQFAVKIKNTYFDKEYVSELKQFLKYEANSVVARYSIYPVFFGLAILYAFGTAHSPLSVCGEFCSFAGFVVLELLLAVGLTWVIFTFVHPYDKIAQRNRHQEINRIMLRFKGSCDKETEMRIIQGTTK